MWDRAIRDVLCNLRLASANHNGVNGSESKTTCMFHPVHQVAARHTSDNVVCSSLTGWRLRGRSLPSPTASCCVFLQQGDRCHQRLTQTRTNFAISVMDVARAKRFGDNGGSWVLK